MRKVILIICLGLLHQHVGYSQNTPQQNRLIVNAVDSIVGAYTNYGTLLEPGMTKVTDVSKKKYLSLFRDTLSTAYGDLLSEKNPELIKDGKKPKIVILPVNELVTRTSGKFRFGLKISIVNMEADLANIKNNTVRVLISQKITGIKSKGLEVENQDTIAMNIDFGPNYSDAKIKSIEATGLGGHIEVSDADKKELEALKPQKRKK